MKPKHQRLWFIGVSMFFLCVATLLTLEAFRNNLVFFFSPTDLQTNRPLPGQLVRVGGLVVNGSIIEDTPGEVRFKVSDGNADLKVEFHGIVPVLFREQQGAIAEGYLKADGVFEAKRILTKHDEKYMPKEIVDSLKKNGHWHENPSSP